MNKAILYGFVGQDPEIKKLESGKIIAKFTLATSSSYKNPIGEKITETTWHNIIYWNKPAEIVEKFVKKGSALLIEGEIRYRSYEDKEGNTKYFTEIIGNQITLCGNKSENKKDNKVSAKISDINDLPIGNPEDDPSYIPENIDDIPF